jgi:hypothetical protein
MRSMLMTLLALYSLSASAEYCKIQSVGVEEGYFVSVCADEKIEIETNELEPPIIHLKGMRKIIELENYKLTQGYGLLYKPHHICEDFELGSPIPDSEILARVENDNRQVYEEVKCHKFDL